VGKSITHAAGQDGRRAALQDMADVLRRRGQLVQTSRTRELHTAQRPGLSLGDKLIERNGGDGLLIYDWLPAADRSQRRHLDLAVVPLDAGNDRIEAYTERLTCWPF
jgi:hypothetical protein